MVVSAQLAAVEEELAGASIAHRAFFIPVVRAIAALGGRARTQEVIKQIRIILQQELSPEQLDYLEFKNRYGWARMDLKRVGIIGGERGTWELTELGRAYEAAHAGDEIHIPLDIPAADSPAPSTVQTETVPVTANAGYEIPLLEVLAEGVTDKNEIFERLHQAIETRMLLGDERKMRDGETVWLHRAYWALSNLGRSGDVENIGTGQWSITSSGRERLAREREGWDIRPFQRSQAKVRVEDGGRAKPTVTPERPDWPSEAWNALRKKVSRSLFEDLTARLRPDLGPTPDQKVARNVILYGPPGTGKTYIAKAVAQALTGNELAAEDERFRLVQFHPSYAYEDFVQGLRPDLKQTSLRYELQQGPFLRIARDAAQEPDAFYVLVIDEINRGDPARIFGELLYALEYRDEPVTLPLGGELVVPSNLVIIGTMNSVDRSVALVDYALRRRFGFVRIDPDPGVIATVRSSGLLAEAGPIVLERFNRWLGQRLDREHVLGHSFFLTPAIPDDADNAFDRLWRLDIHPLLEEYFFGDEDGLAEATKEWGQIVAAEREARAQVEAEEASESGEAP
jgi:5-methylcytosine-specific restriction protein B